MISLKKLKRPLPLIGLAFLGTCTALYLLRGVLIAPILKTVIISTVKSRLDTRLTIGSVGGDYFRSLEVDGVATLEAPADGPLTGISLRRARFEYSLPALAGGVDDFISSLSADLEGVRIALDLSRGGKSAPPPSQRRFSLPPSLPRVTISDGSLSLSGRGIAVDITGVEANAMPGGPGEGLLLEGDLRLFGAEANLSGSLGEDLLRFGWDVTGLDLEKALSSLLPSLPEARGLLATSGEMRIDPSRLSDGEGKISLVLREGAFRGFTEVAADLEAAVKQGRLEATVLRVSEGANVASLDGLVLPLAPDIHLQPLEALRSLQTSFTLELDDVTALLAHAGRDLPFPGEGKAVHRVHLTGDIGRGTVRISSGRIEAGEGVLEAGSTRIDLPRDGEGWRDLGLEAELRVDLPDLEQVMVFSGLPRLTGSLRGEGSVKGTAGSPRGSFEAEGKGVTIGGIPLGDLAVRGSAGGGDIVIETLRAGRGEDHLQASGSLSLRSPFVKEIVLEASLGALEEYLPGDLSENRALKGPLLLSALGSRRGPSFHIRRFEGTLAGNTYLLREARADVDALIGSRPADLFDADVERFSFRLTAIPALLSHFGSPPSEDSPATLPVHELLLEGNMHDRTVAFTRGDLTSAGSQVSFGSASIAFPEGLFTWRDIPLAAALDIESGDLEELSALFSLPAGGRDLKGKISLGGLLGSPEANLSLTARDLSFRAFHFGDVNLEARSASGLFEVESLEIRRGQDRLSGGAAILVAERRIEELSLDLSVGDISPYLDEGLNLPWEVKGAVQAALSGKGPLSAPDLVLTSSLAEGRLGTLEVHSARLAAESTEGTILIREAAVTTAEGALSLSARLARRPDDGGLDITLTDLGLSRESVAASLARTARIALLGEGRYTLEDFTLRSPSGTVSAEGLISPGGESKLTLRVHDLSSDGWLEPLAGERFVFRNADVEADFMGSFDNPLVVIRGEVETFGGPAVPLPFKGSFEARYESETVRIGHFRCTAPGGYQLDVEGLIPLNPLASPPLVPGDLALTARVKAPDLAALGFIIPSVYATGGALRGELDLSGTWDAPKGRLSLSAVDVSPPILREKGIPGPLTLDGEAEFTRDGVTLRELSLRSPALTLSSAGTWSGSTSLRNLLRNGAKPPVGTIDLTTKVSFPDLGLFEPGVEAVSRIAGRGEGTVRVAGGLGDPELEGKLTLSDGELVHGLPLPSLSRVTLDLVLKDGELRVESAAGEIGGAPFDISGTVGRSGDGEIALKLSADGRNILLYRDSDLKIRADTGLSLHGPLSRLVLSGNLTLTGGAYTRNIDFLEPLRSSGKPRAEGGLGLFSLREPPLRDMVLNLTLGTARPFAIRNNLTHGTVRPDLSLQGTGELPLLGGVVYVDPMRITLPTGGLNIESGTLRFPESAPDRPVLDLLGRARMMGYDITMLIEGPYDEPVVTVSSSPPLPEDELLLLLLTGRPPTSLTHRDSAGARGVNVAVYLGRSFLARWLSGEEPNDTEAILERFEIDIGREVTRSGEPTIDSTFLVTRDLVRGGDRIYLTSEKDAFDDFNAGVKLVFKFR